ncbi:MAG: DUF1553 domain-containing protein [Verrucomicrobiales bacterium]
MATTRVHTPVTIIALAVLAARAESAPDFEQDVAPVLEAKCLSCHDEAGAKGDFVLETRELALGHPEAIAPGDAESSLLLTLVSGAQPDMPKKGNPLSQTQVKILRAWIDAGAPWPSDRKLVDNPERDLDWWSLQPLAAPAVPAVGTPHPVDSFVAAKLKEKKLNPVGEANAVTLIRRLTYDLTGLPPTPEEVEAFLSAAEANPDEAWRDLVERLLDSPAFGEKFARHWLDVARYAESHGYDKDKPRPHAWPYRDYVIRSFNEDKPFPRFVEEQVAGDVLFPDDPDGVLGLGFLAAGPWDLIGHQEVGEGKLDGRIAKHLDRDEMVSAVFNVFQSTTVQCAQCHHHKFDPVRTEDYYRLHAVFAAVDRADRVYDGLPADLEQRKNAVISRIGALGKEREELSARTERLVSAETSGIDRRLAELKEKHGSAPEPQYGYHSRIAKTPDERKWVQVDLGEPRHVTESRLIPAYDDFGGIGAGFGFPVRYRIEVSNDPTFENGVRVLLDATEKDQPNPGTRAVSTDGDGRPFRYLRLTATKLRERKSDYILALGEIEAIDEGGANNFALAAAVTAKDSIEQKVRWRKANLVDGVFFRELTDDDALAEFRQLQDERDAIEKAIQPPETVDRLGEIDAELKKLEEERKAFPEGQLVYAAATRFPKAGQFTATGGEPRPVHLLHRGDLRTPGDPVRPGAPPLWEGAPDRFVDSAEWDEREARAELARYLTREDNPLLWRSIANRLWQWTFGAPLVGTPNDFGRGGMEPTHPELLDFLAGRLRDDPNHSMKSIVRLLVASDAYRRASTHDEANARIDRDNAYLWRFPRRRLTAEEFRDSALAVSGALRLEDRGGPSFRDFAIDKPKHSPHYQYDLHDPNDPLSHRRTIYRFVVRTQPQPMLTTLDCADPSISVPERDESTTALQALTQWNHRFVEAMSRHFAARLEKETSGSAEATIDRACRLVLGRPPLEEELPVLREHLQEHGEESFARVLFNLNAFVYVD